MTIDDLTVAEVGREADPIFANLFELYMHDMAQWFLFESNNQGRYGYDHVPHWAAGDRFYLAHVGAQPAGFALVGSAARWLDDASAHDVVEFFVLRRYRGTGVSEALARAIWDAYPGQWLVQAPR